MFRWCWRSEVGARRGDVVGCWASLRVKDDASIEWDLDLFGRCLRGAGVLGVGGAVRDRWLGAPGCRGGRWLRLRAQWLDGSVCSGGSSGERVLDSSIVWRLVLLLAGWVSTWWVGAFIWCFVGGYLWWDLRIRFVLRGVGGHWRWECWGRFWVMGSLLGWCMGWVVLLRSFTLRRQLEASCLLFSENPGRLVPCGRHSFSCRRRASLGGFEGVVLRLQVCGSLGACRGSGNGRGGRSSHILACLWLDSWGL